MLLRSGIVGTSSLGFSPPCAAYCCGICSDRNEATALVACLEVEETGRSPSLPGWFWLKKAASGALMSVFGGGDG